MKKGPDFIIIGAMKCATSTLYTQLADQPGIFMTEPKEPNFFSNDEIWSKGINWYASLFAEAEDTAVAGEASTHYTKLLAYPETVHRIADNLEDDVKFVYVMRHPIDRLISHYMHEYISNVFTEPLDQAIDTNPELIEYGLYAQQLEPFIARFGQSRILPVFFDRLLTSPQVELERICKFIGYSGDPIWRQEIKDQNVSKKRLRSTRFLTALMGFWGSETLRRSLIPASVREKIKGNWRIDDRPQLTEERYANLSAIFDRDLAELGKRLNIEIDCANFETVGRNLVPSWAE